MTTQLKASSSSTHTHAERGQFVERWTTSSHQRVVHFTIVSFPGQFQSILKPENFPFFFFFFFFLFSILQQQTAPSHKQLLLLLLGLYNCHLCLFKKYQRGEEEPASSSGTIFGWDEAIENDPKKIVENERPTLIVRAIVQRVAFSLDQPL